MKIGVMLRHLGQHGGGVLVYTQNILKHLLALPTSHEFVLLYPGSEWLGTFKNGHNARVRELALGNLPTILWDQWATLQAEHREHFDLIFNPKYSVPLMARSRTVFVCHGLDWYVMPWGSRLMDRVNHQFLIPRYARKANAIMANSETTRQHLIEFLNVDEDRVHTVYFGIDEVFRKPVALDKLEEVKRKYQLPEKFFLYCGQIYPPKNFSRLVQAYAQVGPELGIHLVTAGQHTWLCEDDVNLIAKLGISQWVVQPGWVPHDSLPAIYHLAEGLLLPSLYEGFGFPLLEAMSCKCPVVTSNRYAMAEIAQDAAVLVDPESVDSIAQGMSQIVTDQALRGALIEAGLRRSRGFTWEECAGKTMKVLEGVMG